VKGSFFEATYSGALSFCRRKYTRELEDVDIAVSGIPWDGAVTNRPGCRFGPRGIREASTQLAELKSHAFGFDPFDILKVTDFGDASLNPHDPMGIENEIYEHCRSIISKGTKTLSFGGDHFVAYPLIKAHAEKYGPVGLLQFDAHCDTWPSSGSLDHGTMFLRAVQEGLIDPSKSIQVGLRTHNDLDVGMRELSASWFHRNGVDATLEEIFEVCGQYPIYLSFDIDVLDPAFAPGTGTPVAGGLATWQALELVRNLEPLNMVGMDLVEVSPAYDHAEMTSLAAASVAYDWIGVMAKRRQAGKW